MFYFWQMLTKCTLGAHSDLWLKYLKVNTVNIHMHTHSHTRIHSHSQTQFLLLAKLAAGSHRKKLTTALTQHPTGRQATTARKGTVGNIAWRIQSKPLRNSRNGSADVAVAVAVRGISQQIVCAFCRRALGSADEFRSRRERVKLIKKYPYNNNNNNNKQ